MFKRPTSSNGSNRTLSVYSGRAVGPNFVIPERLAFEKVVANKTCPPCTDKDFLNFCRFVDFSEENLTFFLWEKDYRKRFFEKQGASDLALAPEWTPAMQEEAILAAQNAAKALLAAKKAEVETNTTEIFAGTVFELEKNKKNPFMTPPDTAADSLTTLSNNPWDALGRASINSSQKTGRTNVTYKTLAEETFKADGVLAPFSIQPFRAELTRITATYLRESSPRLLNLSAPQRHAALLALQYTTHPSALAAVQATVEASLKETHKRFIRHALCNGNEARIIFARGLGAFCIAAGIALFTILSLSRVHRGFRALAAIPLLLGIATLLAGLKGMCVVLHGLHHRHLRPWQIFEDADDEEEAGSGSDKADMDLSRGSDSIDTFATDDLKPTSLEDYPWVARYKKRNVIRKIFEAERWVQEPAIRQMQDRVFFESLAWAALGTGLALALFLALPKFDLF